MVILRSSPISEQLGVSHADIAVGYELGTSLNYENRPNNRNDNNKTVCFG